VMFSIIKGLLRNAIAALTRQILKIA